MDTTDSALIRRYLNGDLSAFEALVERHQRPVFAYLLKMTGRKGDAEDIFQEMWMRALRHLSSYKQKNFRGWLFRIARNLVIDRARRARPDVSLDAPRENGFPLSETMPASAPDPGEQAAHRQLAARIEAAVDTLPAEQKEVFVMRMQGGLPFREIATAQGVSINTALARMQYAVRKLRPLLASHYAEMTGSGTGPSVAETKGDTS